MDAYPHVGQITAQALARDFKCAVLAARRIALSTSAAGKLAAALLDWATSNHLDARPRPQPPTHPPPPHVTHEELGNMSGLSRETVCRLLGQFRREGLLSLTSAHMTLIDPDRLETLYCEKPHSIPMTPFLPMESAPIFTSPTVSFLHPLPIQAAAPRRPRRPAS